MCLLYCLTFYIHTYFSLQLDHSVEVRQQGLYCFPVSFSFVYELVCTLYEFGPQRNYQYLTGESENNIQQQTYITFPDFKYYSSCQLLK